MDKIKGIQQTLNKYYDYYSNVKDVMVFEKEVVRNNIIEAYTKVNDLVLNEMYFTRDFYYNHCDAYIFIRVAKNTLVRIPLWAYTEGYKTGGIFDYVRAIVSYVDEDVINLVKADLGNDKRVELREVTEENNLMLSEHCDYVNAIREYSKNVDAHKYIRVAVNGNY